jgi:hypothetical protein
MFITSNWHIPVKNILSWVTYLSCVCRLLLLYFFLFYMVKDLCTLTNLTLDLSHTEQLTNYKLWKVRDVVIETYVFDRTYIYFLHHIRIWQGNRALLSKLKLLLSFEDSTNSFQFLLNVLRLPFSPHLSHTQTKHTHTTQYLHITPKRDKSSGYVGIQQKSVPWCVSKVLPWLISNSIINRLFQNPYTWSRWVSHLDKYIGHMKLLKNKLYISVNISELYERLKIWLWFC